MPFTFSNFSVAKDPLLSSQNEHGEEDGWRTVPVIVTAESAGQSPVWM